MRHAAALRRPPTLCCSPVSRRVPADVPLRWAEAQLLDGPSAAFWARCSCTLDACSSAARPPSRNAPTLLAGSFVAAATGRPKPPAAEYWTISSLSLELNVCRVLRGPQYGLRGHYVQSDGDRALAACRRPRQGWRPSSLSHACAPLPHTFATCNSMHRCLTHTRPASHLEPDVLLQEERTTKGWQIWAAWPSFGGC